MKIDRKFTVAGQNVYDTFEYTQKDLRTPTILMVPRSSR